MARFTIYSPTGTALYEGTPTFTGQYMKPGLLEFREVALPALMDLVPGCYVDYTRTGHRYRIYTAPQLKKQARTNTYGGAFVYQSVQLYDASKMLEYCPFRDLVLGDNRIHFSTQPSISTFEGCDGLARRFEACLVDQYGEGSWRVRIATAEENPSLHDLMLEPREFTVSGLNILECLDKIYEIWPEVGWVYKVEEVDGVATDTIVIGGGGANPNVGTYAYGKGNGLTSLTRTAANAEEIANRIFAYGSSRNMLPRWYNSQNIKDAESVDIQNLMLPIGPVGTPGTPDYWPGWGETDGERDAAKAFVENAASILKNGLRPATVYFDGKGEYPEIYPSIRETTIGMVRNAIGDSTAKYYPSTAIYTDPDARIDKLLSAQSAFDSGKAGADGKSSTDVGYIPYDHSGSPTPIQIASRSVHTEAFASGTISLTGTGRLNIEVSYPGIGILTGCGAVYLDFTIGKVHSGATTTIYTQRVAMNPGDAGGYSVLEGRISYSGGTLFESGDSLSVAVSLVLDNRTGADDTTALLANVSGTMTVKAYYHRDKTFTISLRQIGFDINEQADLGNGKTIAMRSGDCVGRSFAVKSAQYNATNDCWDLVCWRTEDESLSQWFPNTDNPVRGLENAGQSNEYPGDEFVLLDIAMPDIYIAMASQKLLVAARDLLADSAVERWQYNPEIDAKYMVENARTINAGEAMTISDPDIIGENPESVIVDTITISEGESPIPTYKVTLRDRKKKTWTESAMPETSSSKSVGSTSTTVQPTSTGGGDSFFQLDESGNVTLKSQYQNLWVPGWLASGGIGQGGSGGGGLISSVKGVADLNTPIASESLTETFSAYAIQSIYNSVRLKSAVALSNVLPYASGRVRVATLTIDGTNHDIYAPEPTGGGGVETETDPIFSASAAFGISTTDIANWNAKVSNVQSDWNATTGLAAILNKPSLSAVATSGSYNDLSNKPSIPNEATVSGWGFTKNAGTVTRVAMTVPTGLSVSGSPITASGTLAISFANGYSIPTTEKQSGWDAKYDKPSGGIPKTDLASAVQTSLGKADTSLQSETDPVYSAWIGTSRTKNTVFAAPSNANGTPSFRALVASDIPSLTISKISDAETWISGKGYVTKTGTDTISGAKTFTTNDVILSGVSLLPATDDTGSIGTGGNGGRRFNSAHIRNIYTSYFEFRDGTTQARTGSIGFDIGLGSITVTNNNADYQYRFYAPGGGNGLFFQPASGQTEHVPLGKSDHRWTKIWGEEGDYSGALTLSGSTDATRRIYFGGSTYYIELKDLGSGQNPRYAFHVNAPIYSDSWIATGGIGAGGSGGGSSVSWGTKSGYTRPLTVEGVTETLLLDGALAGYATTAAMNTALAGKQSAYGFTIQGASGATYNLANFITGVSVSNKSADIGTTLTTIATVAGVDIKAKITHQSLSGYATQTWVNSQGFIKTETDPTVPAWAKAENKPSYSLSEISGTSDLRAIEALTGTGFLKRTASNTWALDNTSYLPLAGGTVTGAMEFLGSLAGPIESGTKRYWRIDDDGTAVFDSVSILSLQIGGNAIDFGNFVTLSGAQTITGAKTFSGGITMSGANIVPSADSANSIGATGSRFQNGHIRNFYTTYFAFMSDDGQTQRGNIGFNDGSAQINIVTNGGTYVQYVFNAAYGFFHGGNGAVPCGRSDHRWSCLYSVDGDFSGGLSIGSDIVPATDLGSSLGYSTRRFSDLNVRTIGSLLEINFKNQDNTAQTGYLTFKNGLMVLRSGVDIASSYKQINFYEAYGLYPENGSSINLGYYSSTDNRYRWANIYGVNADLSGNLSLSSTSYIDIGPVRIKFENNALHITKKSTSDTNNYGIYADGFVAAGGIGQTS